MKKYIPPLAIAVLLVLAVLIPVSCRYNLYYVPGVVDEADGFDPLPVEEILGATFYIADTVPSEQAGLITDNGDGTYTIQIRRRSPAYVPSAVFISGPFTFSDYYKIICEFPDDDKPAKPYRVYAFASVATEKIDDAVNSDYPTAVDLGAAAFGSSGAAGAFTLTNEGINTLAVKKNPSGTVKPYCSLVMYLYFNNANMSDPNDMYTFKLKGVRVKHGQRPEGPVIKARAYRDGDPDNALELTDPVLPSFNHRYDSKTISVVSSASLNVDIQVPDEDEGKEFEFVIRGLGMYAGETNLIADGRITPQAIVFENGSAGTSPNGTVTEGTAKLTGRDVPVYTIKAAAVAYDDLFGDGEPGTGVKIKIPGTFTNTSRFTIWLNLPRMYVGE